MRNSSEKNKRKKFIKPIAYSIATSSRAHNVSTYAINTAMKKLNIQTHKIGNIKIFSPEDHDRIGEEIKESYLDHEALG